MGRVSTCISPGFHSRYPAPPTSIPATPSSPAREQEVETRHGLFFLLPVTDSPHPAPSPLHPTGLTPSSLLAALGGEGPPQGMPGSNSGQPLQRKPPPCFVTVTPTLTALPSPHRTRGETPVDKVSAFGSAGCPFPAAAPSTEASAGWSLGLAQSPPDPPTTAWARRHLSWASCARARLPPTHSTAFP